MSRGTSAGMSASPGPGESLPGQFPGTPTAQSPHAGSTFDGPLKPTYAEILAAVMQHVATPPVARVRKVRDIRRRVSRGTYAPAAMAIARRLLGV